MENDKNEMDISKYPASREIIFGDQKGSWFMKITKEGFKFNRERFPHAEIDDFAKAFMELLEKSFDVKFTKKT